MCYLVCSVYYRDVVLTAGPSKVRLRDLRSTSTEAPLYAELQLGKHDVDAPSPGYHQGERERRALYSGPLSPPTRAAPARVPFPGQAGAKLSNTSQLSAFL